MGKPVTSGRVRIGVAVVAGVLAAGAATVALVAANFDPNTQKARIVDAVRRATGRDLVLAGPLQLSLGLSPGLRAEDVSFANRPGGTRPMMATAARVEAHIALWPLLLGRVEIAGITLVRPDILLETDENGVGNWQVQRPAGVASGPADTSSHPAREPVAIDEVDVENGRVTWHDGRTGWTQSVDLQRATVAVGAATQVTVTGQASGLPVHLDATLGTPAQLTGAEGGPFPVRLAAGLGDATLTLDGVTQFPVPEHGFQGRAIAAVPDLAALGPVLQVRALPPLHDLRLDATVSGVAVVQALTLHAGAADLSRYQPGAALGHVDVVYAADQPARVEADGTLANAPWRLVSGLSRNGQVVALRGLSLQSGVADLRGDLAVSNDPPAVRGTLVSHRLDLDALRSLPRPAPVPVPPSPAPAPAASPLVSGTPLPWPLLRRADADLEFTVDTVRVAMADFHGVAGRLSLRDGRLRIDPLSVQAPEGRIDGSLIADASQVPPPVALVLHAPALALNPLAQAFGLPGGSNATAELDVAVQGAGQSPHDLVAHLNGHAGLALVDGEVSNAMLAALLGPLGGSAGLKLANGQSTGQTEVRCLAVRLNLAQGVASVAALQLDTALLDLSGTGTIDLGAETMALRLRPILRTGGLGITTPVKLDGPWAHPVAAQDSAEANGRVGVVIGSAAPDGCPAALLAARDGRTGRQPVEIAAKAAKPADLLRSFLR